MWKPSKMEITYQEVTPEGGVPTKMDLIKELEIDTSSIENFVNVLKEQSQKALFWGGLAIQEARAFNIWENIDYKKWKSHCSKYARLVMKARKDKETIEAVEKVVAEIYSSNVLENEDRKNIYAKLALTAKLGEAQIQQFNLKGTYQQEINAFITEMYHYEQSYEVIAGMYYDMKADRDMFALVADTVKARGYELASIKDLTVGLEGEGFQVPTKTVEALEHVTKILKTLKEEK